MALVVIGRNTGRAVILLSMIGSVSCSSKEQQLPLAPEPTGPLRLPEIVIEKPSSGARFPVDGDPIAFSGYVVMTSDYKILGEEILLEDNTRIGRQGDQFAVIESIVVPLESTAPDRYAFRGAFKRKPTMTGPHKLVARLDGLMPTRDEHAGRSDLSMPTTDRFDHKTVDVMIEVVGGSLR